MKISPHRRDDAGQQIANGARPITAVDAAIASVEFVRGRIGFYGFGEMMYVQIKIAESVSTKPTTTSQAG